MKYYLAVLLLPILYILSKLGTLLILPIGFIQSIHTIAVELSTYGLWPWQLDELEEIKTEEFAERLKTMLEKETKD